MCFPSYVNTFFVCFGSCTPILVQVAEDPWWAVDLGGPYQVDYVMITSRGDNLGKPGESITHSNIAPINIPTNMFLISFVSILRMTDDIYEKNGNIANLNILVSGTNFKNPMNQCFF